MSTIPVAGPWITDHEISLVADAVRNDWYESAGHYIGEFERAFAAYVGRRFAVSLPSCTSGLHLALAACGVGPGDEVIVPETTWIATAAPIVYLGATPVFADIDPRTWCLCAESVKSVLSPRTRAIVPVDLYGGMPDMDSLSRLCGDHGLTMIEDAAEAIGSEYHGRKAGSFGDVSVFSFHGSKTLTTGEGGMLVTDRKDILERVLVLRDHGRHPGDVSFFNTEVGYKYKMCSMQAALGLAQLGRIGELIVRKREIFHHYCDNLSVIECASLNDEPDGTFNSYWMTTLVLDETCGITGAVLQAELARHGVATRPFFHPLSSLPAFAQYTTSVGARERNRNAYAISSRGINLPSALCLKSDDIRFVCGIVSDALREMTAQAAIYDVGHASQQ